ncbi:oligosaccharide flippase family protein [Jannaschia marina]|uniref:oligosaccharide flippase family protein n=1 Tax=Jannaschia marina TaxID=2741674 RepID=UPI0015CDBA65|nr:oligosaccharide flippase family protein [Jannaschia marina]
MAHTEVRPRKAALDVTFSVLERAFALLAQFVVFVVAARVLGPAEFGIFALASAVAALLLRVAEAGWAPFILSWSGDITVPLQVLYVAVLAGAAIGVAGGAAVLTAGQVFGLAPDLVALMLWFGLWVALANAASAQKGLLIWLGRIRAAALCEIAGECAALVTTLAALTAGAGVFALIYGRLATVAVTLTGSFLITRQLPRRGLPRAQMQALRVFSAQIFSARMLIHLRLHFITLIVGTVLGPAAAGIFRAADRLVGALAELINVPGQIMAWSLLRRARDAGEQNPANRVNVAAARLLYGVVMLGAPLLLWAMLMREEIVGGLLGPDWAAAAPLVAILALSRLLLLPGVMTEPLMSVMGQAGRLPWFTAVIFVCSVALTLAAAPAGLHALAWSQVAVSVVVLVSTVWFFARFASVRWRIVGGPLLSTVLPLGCGTATIALLKAHPALVDWPEVVQAGVSGLAGAAVLGGLALLMTPALRAGVLQRRGRLS